ncbi:hypothetical protein FA13DRAFT_1716296 [Coprinellus micaceus]|uniref:Uncharacterized protein n=1 Tax=Coprinellus micaceus TaxID=71717 RepID=A0A4Y7SK15_COPMI|nr:hypothetical protein FA13DRAFT_1716296 [Coprinellus micaceus]
MVYDPTAWVEGTPMNKYEFGDLTIATADIKCPSTGIIMIFKGTHAKVDSGAWNPKSRPRGGSEASSASSLQEIGGLKFGHRYVNDVENTICLSGNLAFPSHDRPGAMFLSPLIPNVQISLYLTLTFPPIYFFFPRALENRFSDPLNTPQRLYRAYNEDPGS